jgi:hypothetical protein
MTNYFKHALTALCMLLLLSCEKQSIDPAVVPSSYSAAAPSKDKDKQENGKQLEKNLAGNSFKKWKYEKYIINGQSVGTAVFPPCIWDDVLVFTKDKKYIELEGPTKCAPELSDTLSKATYYFYDDHKKFYQSGRDLNGLSYIMDADILELTDDSFKIRFVIPEGQYLAGSLAEFWVTSEDKNKSK